MYDPGYTISKNPFHFLENPSIISKLKNVLIFFYLQARDQKKTYQGLKNEVVSSQKMLYYSQQGFVRPRPITAPNLTAYRQTDAEMKRKMSEAAHNALYNKYQKILKNAYNKGKGEDFNTISVLKT